MWKYQAVNQAICVLKGPSQQVKSEVILFY